MMMRFSSKPLIGAIVLAFTTSLAMADTTPPLTEPEANFQEVEATTSPEAAEMEKAKNVKKDKKKKKKKNARKKTKQN